jgi:hypothetical protein
MEIGEILDLEEIEDAFRQSKVCPRCDSTDGFWLGLKHGHAYVQCKNCGGKFELFKIFKIPEEDRSPRWLKIFRN